MDKNSFLQRGWTHFPFDPVLAQWVKHVLPHARTIVNAAENRQWLRCGGTWFAGVNILDNDENGKVSDGPVLAGNCINFIGVNLGIDKLRWDPGQVSICYPGYPQPMESESETAFNYRLNRDAAHVDGLLPEAENRRRHLREYHAFILGIPLVETSPDASPLVVWEGSHEIIRNAFRGTYGGLLSESWGELDVTDVYQKTRRIIFDSCKRVEVFAKPGECYLVHRLTLHGVSPWREQATASSDGRMICYFRPEISEPTDWLNNP